jgi:hypothetical protein
MEVIVKKSVLGFLLLVFLGGIVWADIVQNGGGSTFSSATITTLTATDGTITTANISSGTVSGQLSVGADVILYPAGKGIKQVGNSGTISYILRRDTDERLYVYSRDGELRLTTGSSGITGLEVDTSQNISIPNGTVTASTVSFSGLTGIQANSAPRTNITPTRTGQIIYNSTGKEVCFSTGTVVSSWVQIDDSTSACSN